MTIAVDMGRKATKTNKQKQTNHHTLYSDPEPFHSDMQVATFLLVFNYDNGGQKSRKMHVYAEHIVYGHAGCDIYILIRVRCRPKCPWLCWFLYIHTNSCPLLGTASMTMLVSSYTD